MENNTELNIVKKNAQAYAYKYTDIAEITKFLAERGETYNQEIKRTENGTEYIVTHKINEKGEKYESCEGATVLIRPIANMNEVQAYGSSVTYARRYSLLLAYGLATEDDDAQLPTNNSNQPNSSRQVITKELDIKKTAQEKGQKVIKELIEKGLEEEDAKKELNEYIKKNKLTIKQISESKATDIKKMALEIMSEKK